VSQFKLALKRFGQPEEIAATVAFLASQDASYITGVEINVECAVQLDMEGINPITELLRHEEKLAIGTKRQRCRTRVGAGQKSDGICYRPELSVAV
jgi:hypothetical protein